MAREWDPNNIFDVLADERVRSILIASNGENRSVKDLHRVLDASLSSIYRRVDVMAEFDLLDEQTEVDAEGHHYSVYTPKFTGIEIVLLDHTLEILIRMPDDTTARYKVPDD